MAVHPFDLTTLDGTNGFRISGADTGDEFGHSVSAAGDVNGDGIGDLIIGARNAHVGIEAYGAAYVVFGGSQLNGADLNLAALDGTNGFRIAGAVPGDQTGYSVDSAGDINNDGFADVIVGAPTTDQSGHNSGSAYVVFGRASGFSASISVSALTGTSGFKIAGEAQEDWAGVSVSRAGDINGDGYDDVVIGAPFSGGGFLITALSPGAAYVVFGQASAFDAVVSLTSLDGSNGFKLAGTDPEDFAGYSVSEAGDVNGDGFTDIIIGAKEDSNTRGAAYVVFGKASGFQATLDLSALDGSTGFKIVESSFQLQGLTVGGAGDVNGDGYSDLVLGSPSNGAGAAYVVFGTGNGFAARFDVADLNGSNGFKLTGTSTGDNTGFSVSGIGSFNDDNFADIVITANFARASGGLSGQSYVVFGKASGFSANIDLATLDGHNGFAIPGQSAGDQAGFSASGAGDLNGDGSVDLIIGAPGDDTNAVRSGAAYVIFGGDDSTRDLADLNGTTGFRLSGGSAGERAGSAISVAGDVNGDGYDDLILGASGADTNDSDAGAAYVVFGRPATLAPTLDLGTLNGTNGFRLDGPGQDAAVGIDVAAAGDIDGDGFDDVLIGAPAMSAGGAGAGAAYVVFGKANGFAATTALATLDGVTGFRITGAHAGDSFGASVDGAGDVNGDGYADVVIGAPGHDANGSDAGAAYVVFGKAGGFAADDGIGTMHGSDGFKIVGVENGDRAGTSVSGAGDVNGDGIDDLIVGASTAHGAAIDSGAAYVIFGRSEGFAATMVLNDLDGSNGFMLAGAATADEAGFDVGPAGDINGDGFDDLVVGAVGAVTSYVVFGKAASHSPALNLGLLDGTDGFRLIASSGDGIGTSVRSAGDVNADGYDDLMIGAPGTPANGASHLIYGRSTGFTSTLALADLDGEDGFSSTGVAAGDLAGRAVSGAGDVNGDGYADMLTGAPNADSTGNDAGAAYLVYGGDSSGVVSHAGSASDDALVGTIGADWMLGGAGNDSLQGRDGIDTLRGGNGNDTADGGNDADRIYGGEGNDSLLGDPGNDRLYGGDGDDVLTGHNDNDRLEGEAGNDVLFGGSGDDILLGGTGDDQGWGEQGADLMLGGTGNDSLYGEAGADRIYGDAGDDALYGGADADLLQGGSGDDRLYGDVGDDRIFGGIGLDMLQGEDGDDALYGGDGDDTLFGQAGADALYGEEGDDNLLDSAGDDVLFGGTGSDLLLGGDDDDRLLGGAGNDLIFGESGSDELQGDDQDDRLFGGQDADLIFGEEGNDELHGNEGNDRLFGGTGADLLFGQDDDDELQGEAGDDRLFAGDGNDMLFGQSDNDELQGQAGHDRLFGGQGADLLFGQDGNDELQGDADNDRLFGGAGSDALFGQGGDDELQGEDDDDRLFGGSGNDNLFGQNGNDELQGADGSDQLLGGDGDDLLYGGAGNDALYGGTGADRFVFLPGDGYDVIADFEDGVDLINLRGYAGAGAANTVGLGSGGGTVVILASLDVIVLMNIAPAAITAADFLFA